MKEMNPMNVRIDIDRNRESRFHPARKKGKKQDEFKRILDAYLSETAEELEEYPVRFPKHGHFWDNGYEDVG